METEPFRPQVKIVPNETTGNYEVKTSVKNRKWQIVYVGAYNNAKDIRNAYLRSGYGLMVTCEGHLGY